MSTSYKISGQVVTHREQKGILNLFVKAWDKEQVIVGFLGKARTDKHGKFVIEVKEEYRSEIFQRRKPDIYFKVYQKRRMIYSTEREIHWNVSDPEKIITIKLKQEIKVAYEQPPVVDVAKVSLETKTKEEVATLHKLLSNMNFKVAEKEVAESRVGASSIKAIKKIQDENNLEVSGKLDANTVELLNREQVDFYFRKSKTRIAGLHEKLEKLGLEIGKDEKKSRHLGEATRDAIASFASSTGIETKDGKITEELYAKLVQEGINQKYSTKTQVGKLQNQLKRVSQIGKLNIEIDGKELTEKTFGESTKKAIQTFQESYNIEPTGELNQATLDKLESVSKSQGYKVKMMPQPKPEDLKLIKTNLRLNKTSPRVADLQKVLTSLGYPISAKESNTYTFGKTTEASVRSYQRSAGLVADGKVEKKTMAALNRDIIYINPGVTTSSSGNYYRVKGSVRDELLKRTGNMAIHVYERKLDGTNPDPLATKKNHQSGFFDFNYQAPIDPITGQIKKNFHLEVKLFNSEDELVASRVQYNVAQTQWFNFNLADEPYRGEPLYFQYLDKLTKKLDGASLGAVSETGDNAQITLLSKETGLPKETVMRLVFCELLAKDINNSEITPEVLFALIKQNFPARLPGNLLEATLQWKNIDKLVEDTSTGLVFSDNDSISGLIDSAIKQNLVSISVKHNKENILESFNSVRNLFTLEKPILVGNGTLKSVLDETSINSSEYEVISMAFANNSGVSDSFWEELESAGLSNAEINDLKATMDLSLVTKSHNPTLHAIKADIADPGNTTFTQASDVAKLDVDGWVQYINDNGGAVPDNMPGDSTDEQIMNYAISLESITGRKYPAISQVARIKQGGNHQLTQIDDIESFLDADPELDFKRVNIDKYDLDNSLNMGKTLKDELKLVQRAHKNAFDSGSCAALVAESMHSSYQIYMTGKTRLVNKLQKRGVAKNTATKIYERAKSQYAQVLARFMEFRPEVNREMPAAIQNFKYDSQEVQDLVSDIPDLEALFGSMDACECKHCESLYGPAAYFTDMLRFLGKHDSLIESGGVPYTVQEILLDRRPDLGNIKLNCQNTHTAMPYIDLACEVLENIISPQQQNFNHQTTLTAPELEAIPEHTRPHAYEVLAGADYPMNNSFNLWQEEARLNLEHFELPRWELMEAFQNIADPTNPSPNKVSIAAEFFKLSTHELNIIKTEASISAQQDVYWGIDTTQASVNVKEFMDITKLTYDELLELLLVKFINDPSGPSPMEIQRLPDNCDLSQQIVTNLTVGRFDLMHRFLRLWRKTGWEMWEIGYLLKNQKVGNNKIDGDVLVKLKEFKQLQDKLGLGVEVLLAFYGNIITESRIQPDKPNVSIPSVYEKHFLDVTSADPTDTSFTVTSLDGSITLATDPVTGYTPVTTILSALAITQEEFDLIDGYTDGTMTLQSLSILFRHSYLAKGLNLSIADLIKFYRASGMAGPFQSTGYTLEFIEQLELVKESGLSMLELEYILHYDKDSSVGLREKTLVQYFEALRGTLEKNKELIEKLNISDADKTMINAVDTSSLTGKTNAEALLVTSITDLQITLGKLSENFTNATFLVDEVNYITSFKDSSSFFVDTLIEMIDTLQSEISNLYGNGENQVISLVAGQFSLKEKEAGVIVNELKAPGTTKKLIDILTDETLAAKDANGDYTEISTTNFPSHFDVYNLVHKVSVLHGKVTFEEEELEWFIKNQASVSVLDYGSLPVKSTAPDASFANWLNLYKFAKFYTKYPEPEDASLVEILKNGIDPIVSKSNTLKLIAALTQWDETEVNALDTGFGLLHASGTLDYAKAGVYMRLEKAMKQAKLTGVECKTMFSWALRDNLQQQKQIASQTKYAIKSKYDSNTWLDKITPIQNKLRERKRYSLVQYHLDNSQRNESTTISVGGKDIPNPLYWKDSTAMFKYFLIDVEMGPDQLTSRLKQAISSVQFFVQRCFLNLEQRYVQVSQEDKTDVASENAWSQWKWMKTYRVWEANRKVFFYPENWIEPELRDDKSPFFEELEQELMQGEVTDDNAEVAFLNYLHKVDEVANLEVCGLYHEYEDLNDEYEGYEIDNVHVVARTKDDPSTYFHRIFDMNYSTWTAWEKIDVDITGDHAVPVVYNRKLHIFWLSFIEKPQKVSKNPAAKATTGPSDAPEAQKVLEIQLCWTVKKDNGWKPKSISKLKLIHPWERPYFSYHLKPFYKSYTNELWLDLYITTSKEFNERKFYDPYWTEGTPKYAKATHIGFNETYRPWHSSSFIFNGKVKEVKMNALSGQYRLITESKPTGNSLVGTDSVAYVQTNYSEDGRAISKFSTYDDGPKLDLPSGMHYHNNHLRNNQHYNINNSQLNILANGSTQTLLNGANKPFELVIDHQDIPFDAYNTDHPFFYQDAQRAFFIKPDWLEHFDDYGNLTGKTRQYGCNAFYHPYTTLFIRELNRDGLDALLTRKVQTKPASFPPGNDFTFSLEYLPVSKLKVDGNAAKDIVDFSLSGAYSIYNWEVFFHAPMMIANRLMQNQRFEEAMKWFHYIFDPTNIDAISSPQRYWITKPFYEHNDKDYSSQRIENILTNIDAPEFQKQLIAWRNDPFKPHLIARYRPVAYQKNVVMKYLDNLIAWGDQLFRRDTMESINEASSRYMLASEILGERPKEVPNVEHEELSFNELPNLDDFGNTRVDVIIENTLLPIKVTGSKDGLEPLPNLDTLYFGIPGNDFMLKYWNIIYDRMFKIRNSMNIEGVKRTLSLFAPPIDPALLVKAAAAGMDLSTVLNDISAGTPHYRFRTVLQKAVEFCSDVKQLGDKLLSALEKKDVEGLAQLRTQHEIQLSKGIKLIKEKEVDEADEAQEALEKSKELAKTKETYYGGREYMNTAEIIGFSLNTASTALDAAIAFGYILSGGLSLIPNFLVGAAGFGGTPEVNATMGGQSISNSAELAVKTISSIASALQKGANLAETQARYQRRMDDWKHQKELASIEVEQIEYQISAAQIRKVIAEKDLENQKLQIENSEQVYGYMKNKYTNDKLYNWMVTQISTTYFQSYQLAYEMAKKAEKCYQHELGVEKSSFIQFGYWDSLKKGLLSGEKLMHDLKDLERAYMDQNKRELEITKHISLAQVAPLSLIDLKQNGECTLVLPEWLFDMDYPGHYMRRIKTVSISIPCVTGPYTSINCILSLIKHETRVSSLLDGGKYKKKEDAEDARFKTRFGAISSIATSSGQGDSGMFELNFNDERYLPFEGAGADSEWLVTMPKENNYFDFSTISDVILHVNYTARSGGVDFSNKAQTYLDTILPSNSYKLFSLKHEFPNEWHKFLNPGNSSDQEFAAKLTTEHYPFFVRNKLSTWIIKKVDWFIQSEDTGNFVLLTDVMAGSYDTLPGTTVSSSAEYDDINHWRQDLNNSPTGDFKFKLQKSGAADFKSLATGDLDNIFVVIHLGK